MKMPNRRGFTLTELLVVTVLGTVLLMTIYQVVIGNQRIYVAQQAQVEGMQTVRTGVDVLFGELREVSASGGDIVAMDDNSLRVRVYRSFGHMCAAPLLSPFRLLVTRTGRPFQSSDSIFIFADNNPSMASDDVWMTARLNNVDTSVNCPGGQPGQRLTVESLPPLLASNDVRQGAVIRAYEHYEYAPFQREGEWYLGRRSGNVTEPMVGPIREGTGVRFEYFDADGETTTTPADVARIRVVVESASDVRDSRGRLVADSLVAMVYTRN